MKNILTKEQIMLCPELLLKGFTRAEIASTLKTSKTTINRLFIGKSYFEFQEAFQKRLSEVKIFLAGPSHLKTCTRCKRVLPKTAEFFQPLPIPSGFECRCKECKSKANITRYRESRLRVLEHYSGGTPKCACCGETIYEFLTIDHINGGGRKHREELKKGKGGVCSIHIWLERNGFPEGFQVLCFNCNGAKGFFGTCPHQRFKQDF